MDISAKKIAEKSRAANDETGRLIANG